MLGPDDQISVAVLNVDEIGPQLIQLDMERNISLALAGRNSFERTQIVDSNISEAGLPISRNRS